MSGTVLPAQSHLDPRTGAPLSARPPTARFAMVPQLYPVPFVTPRLPKVRWDDKIDLKDIPAACNVLLRTGFFDDQQVTEICYALQHAPIVEREARDILNVSLMPLLPPNDPQVAYGMSRVRRGKHLNPVLLVEWRPLILADGHHRTCVSYYASPQTHVHCAVV